FSAIEQMGTLSRGVIDTRPFVLYLSMTIVMLTFTYQAFPSRKWRLYSMADETTPPAKPKKIRRLQIGLNVIVQIGIVIVLAAMVNYLGFEHYRRWDLSRDKKYQLSDKTKHFLESIKGKLRITVFFGSQNPISGDVQNLLTEYQYASRGKIDVEYVDPERNLTRAKELFDKY